MTQEPDPEGLTPFMRGLIERIADPTVSLKIRYRVFSGLEGQEEPESVTDFVGIESSDLSATARQALDELDANPIPAWARFKWKLTAFAAIQDIFDAMAFKRTDEGGLGFLHQYYCYYESLDLLRESLLCGLSGYTIAAHSLLRPFLEFSLLQAYFYRHLRAEKSLVEMERFYVEGVRPRASTLVKRSVPDDDFGRVIRFRMQEQLSGLSESTQHAYHPAYSSAQFKNAPHEHSFESLHFWLTTQLALDAALWLYFVNFPMLFHPVDVVRKFGMNGPVGLYVDREVGVAVRNSMDPESYSAFRQYAANDARAKDLLASYDLLPNLTDAQIEESWKLEDQEMPFPGIVEGYAHTMAKTRAVRTVLARRRMAVPNAPKQTLQDAQTLEGWRRLSRISSRREGKDGA